MLQFAGAALLLHFSCGTDPSGPNRSLDFVEIIENSPAEPIEGEPFAE
jgi:hypothetical protein